MTSFIAKYISKKILGESLANNFGKEDPYFETVPATRLDGKPTTKTKKRRKALPAGISEHDGKILTKVKRRAYRLDMSLFNCCGIRFGWSSVIGIIPGVGDVIDAFMAMMVLRTCQQIEGGLPADVKSKMMFNIILDFGIGLVPFLGDIADAVFRANTRNAVVLENFLRKKGEKALKAQGQAMPTLDPTDPDAYDQHIRDESPPAYATTATTQAGTHRTDPDRTRTDGRGSEAKKGGWFSGYGSKKKQPDVEQGGDRIRREGVPLTSNAGNTLRREDAPLPVTASDGLGRDQTTMQGARH